MLRKYLNSQIRLYVKLTANSRLIQVAAVRHREAIQIYLETMIDLFPDIQYFPNQYIQERAY
jgi:hypothetical protein